MDKSVLMRLFSQVRQNVERRHQFISHQREVIALPEKDGLVVDDSRSLLDAVVIERDKDLLEMDWTLDELDKTAAPVGLFSTPSLWPYR
jgi:hypothetical protein